MATILLSLLIMPLMASYVAVGLLVMDTDRAYAQYALIVPVAYVLGSIPWGFLLTMAARGVDIREYGSGKIGMSNVLRTAGGPIAVLGLLLDLSKGLVAVLLAWVVSDSDTLKVAAGLAALAGHNWSIFLAFKGGRGISTGVGGLLIMEPIAGAIAFGVFTPVTLISRYLSLGSITAVVVAFLAVLVMVLLDYSSSAYLYYTGIGGAIIIWQHRDNIRRLFRGTERRLGQRASRVAEAAEHNADGA